MEAQINLLPKQTEAWEQFEKEYITELGYGGAAGGGKTRLGWYLVIAMAETYPGSRCAVGRKELKNFKATTLTELWEIFTELGYVINKDYFYNDQKSVLTFSNGSEVVMKDTAYSPQDPEYTNLGGLPLTWAWLDESNETPEKAKAILKTRVGRLNKFKDGRCVSNVKEGDTDYTEIKPFWLETFNPNKGHVYRDYYKPWKEGTMPEYRAFIRALPGDNPHLSRSYINNLERADKITRERLLKGNFEFDADPQKLMLYDAIMSLTTNIIADNSKDKMLSADIARFGGDKIVFGVFNGRILTGLYVYTYQGVDITVDKLKDIAHKNSIPFNNIIIDEANMGGGVVDYMRGVNSFDGSRSALPVWNFITDSMSPANFANFRSQCYFKLSEMVNDRMLLIDIQVFETNIEGYTKEQAISDLGDELDAIKETDKSFADDGKKAIIPKALIKEALGRSPDFADILMMRMFFELKKKPLKLRPDFYNDLKMDNPAI